MKTIFNKGYIGIMTLMLLFVTGTVTAQDSGQLMDDQKRQQIKADAQKAKEAFIARNPEIKQHFQNSAGYAIFPNVGKGAYILGGAAGNGVLYENGEVAGYAELRQIDIGFQIGGKAFREVIIFKSQEALERFKAGNFEFQGTASAVIWDEGRAKAIQFRDGVGVAVMPKAGAMVGVSVGGQEFNYRPVQ